MEDRAKKILDKLNIKSTDEWKMLRNGFRGSGKSIAVCYYHSFELNGKTHCISADNISIVVSNEKEMIYMGYSEKEAIEAIKGRMK